MMLHDTAPFNCDTFMEKEFLRLKTTYGLTTVIETGTYHGITTRWLAEHFAHVFTVELVENHYKKAVENLRGRKNVTMINGDSLKHFPLMLLQTKGITSTPLVFLDDHWYENPLLKELELIKQSLIKPVLCVHDMKNPHDETMGYDAYPTQNIEYTLEWIKSRIDAIYGGESEYEYYFNKEATGARRGALFCIPKGLQPVPQKVKYECPACKNVDFVSDETRTTAADLFLKCKNCYRSVKNRFEHGPSDNGVYHLEKPAK